MTDNSDEGKRRRLGFVAMVASIVVVCLVAVAVAGDDELRAKLFAWAKRQDR